MNSMEDVNPVQSGCLPGSCPCLLLMAWCGSNPNKYRQKCPTEKLSSIGLRSNQKTLTTPQKHISFLQNQKQLKLEVNTPFFRK